MQISAHRTIKSSEGIAEQARRLHEVASELLKAYQFRDRNEICCHGVSVAQCYALEALGEAGTLAMGELARLQRVSVSTMTRVVDGLVGRGLVRRWLDSEDRRVIRVRLTEQGRALLEVITGELVARERAVLELLPPEHRESLIFALEQFADAMQTCCATPARRAEKGAR